MRWLLGLAVTALLVGASPVQAADIPAPVWKAYRTSIKTASSKDRDPVVHNLVQLKKSDPRVRWRSIDGRRHVLVATVRRDPVSDVARGEAFDLRSAKWVVVPRQLRQRCVRIGCRSMGPRRLDLTIKQFIGLPPDGDYRLANTFWARPRDIFRPCLQPSVRASSCPRRARGPLPTINGTSVRTFLRDQAEYAWRWPRRWNPATAVSCSGAFPEPRNCYGFPWTELGYTYDWAPNRSHIGLSEFVVTAGSRVYLNRVQSQRAFLARGRR